AEAVRQHGAPRDTDCSDGANVHPSHDSLLVASLRIPTRSARRCPRGSQSWQSGTPRGLSPAVYLLRRFRLHQRGQVWLLPPTAYTAACTSGQAAEGTDEVAEQRRTHDSVAEAFATESRREGLPPIGFGIAGHPGATRGGVRCTIANKGAEQAGRPS
ncbi:unnamed protein product, partial [Symbiodinium pilosum]